MVFVSSKTRFVKTYTYSTLPDGYPLHNPRERVRVARILFDFLTSAMLRYLMRKCTLDTSYQVSVP